MPENDNSINKRIANYRSLAGYTQETAAIALNLNKNTYARMERSGSPKPELLKKMAKLFNVSTEQILYENPIIKTEAINDNITLHDKGINLEFEKTDMLTTTEKNCIRLCRMLSNNDRNDLANYIEKYVKEHLE